MEKMELVKELRNKAQGANGKVKVAYCQLANLKLTTYVICKNSNKNKCLTF